MSLDIYFKDPTATYCNRIHEQNITHNLGLMASKAGIHDIVWHPNSSGIDTAGQLIEPLTRAIEDMKARPEYYRRFDSPNGWGTYDDFVPWLDELLENCKRYPQALLETSV